MQAQETNWTERRFCSKHQKTTKKQKGIPYSLKTYSKNIKQKHVQWMKDIHQTKTMILWKGHLRKALPNANKMKNLFFLLFSF